MPATPTILRTGPKLDVHTMRPLTIEQTHGEGPQGHTHKYLRGQAIPPSATRNEQPFRTVI